MQNLDLKNKTVFITGVAGFIGSNLAERLLKEIEGMECLFSLCQKIAFSAVKVDEIICALRKFFEKF